jgi:hypothetical protein
MYKSKGKKDQTLNKPNCRACTAGSAQWAKASPTPMDGGDDDQ